MSCPTTTLPAAEIQIMVNTNSSPQDAILKGSTMINQTTFQSLFKNLIPNHDALFSFERRITKQYPCPIHVSAKGTGY